MQSSSSFSDSFVKVDYPSYPVLAPSAAGPAPAAHVQPYGQSSYTVQYPQPAQQQQHAYQLSPQQAQQHQQQSQPQPSYQHTTYAAYSAPHEPPVQVQTLHICTDCMSARALTSQLNAEHGDCMELLPCYWLMHGLQIYLSCL